MRALHEHAQSLAAGIVGYGVTDKGRSYLLESRGCYQAHQDGYSMASIGRALTVAVDAHVHDTIRERPEMARYIASNLPGGKAYSADYVRFRIHAWSDVLKHGAPQTEKVVYAAYLLRAGHGNRKPWCDERDRMTAGGMDFLEATRWCHKSAPSR